MFKLVLLKLILVILESVYIIISRNVFVNRVKKSLLLIKFIFWRVVLFRLIRDRLVCLKLIKLSLEKLRSVLNKLIYGVIIL